MSCDRQQLQPQIVHLFCRKYDYFSSAYHHNNHSRAIYLLSTYTIEITSKLGHGVSIVFVSAFHDPFKGSITAFFTCEKIW